jgi:hypothetical protein
MLDPSKLGGADGLAIKHYVLSSLHIKSQPAPSSEGGLGDYLKMFKEVVVSAAIILGFLINVAFVDHPNITTYTIAFALSLAGLSPFVFWWRYRTMKKALRAVAVEDGVGDATPLIPLSVGQVLGLSTTSVSEPDIEKGIAKPKEEASGSACGEGS